MKYQQIEIKIISVSHHTPSVIRGDYTELETIHAQDSGGKRLKLTRFVRSDEYRVKENQVYEGTLKPATDPDKYNDTIERLKPLNSFNGIEDMGQKCWDYSDPVQEALEHQAKMEAWGDIHTAAPIVATILECNISDKGIAKKLINIALICKEARLELTKIYIKEMREEK